MIEGEDVISACNINEFVQEDLLVSISVTLCTHGFDDGICSKGSDFVVYKFNIVNLRVYNGIIMGASNDVSLSVKFVADYGRQRCCHMVS